MFEFSQQIVPSVKAPIAAKTLAARLGRLADALSALDQDCDTTEIQEVARQLVSKKLLQHKDATISVTTALCLAQVLRLFAPNAPYTAAQLTDIFYLFTRSLKPLRDTTSPLFDLSQKLLVQLAEVRSIVLITDLPKSEALVQGLFDVFYTEISCSGDYDTSLTPYICDILSEVVAEIDLVPKDVLKQILSQFLKRTKQNAFQYTVAICSGNLEKIGRQTAQFFSETIYDNSYGTGGELDAIALKNLEKIHRLVVEIWNAVPNLLPHFIGLVDAELFAENPKIRALATKAIGSILASTSEVSFEAVHKETWQNWCKKVLDISPVVRGTWVQESTKAVAANPQLAAQMSNGVLKCLLDSDDTVRLKTVESVQNLKQIFTSSVEFEHKDEILTTVGQLCREKHPRIRQTAIEMLADFYNDSQDSVSLSWVPSCVLNLLYINDVRINELTDSALVHMTQCFEGNHEKRVARLASFYKSLDTKAQTAFWVIAQRQKQLSEGLSKFCHFLQDDADVGEIIDWLCIGLPDQDAARETLQRFAQEKDKRSIHLLEISVAPANSIDKIVKSYREFLSKLGENDAKTWKLLLLRSVNLWFNKSNLESLMAQEEMSQFLQKMSEYFPQVFQDQTWQLCENLNENDLKLADLQMINNFLSNGIELSNLNTFTLIRKALNEATPKMAQVAVQIVSKFDKSELSEFTDEILPLDKSKANFTAHLAILSQMFLESPSLVSSAMEDCTQYLVSNILLQNEQEYDVDWISDSDLESGSFNECYNKMLTLEIFVHRLLSLQQSGSQETSKIAPVVLKLLVSCISNGGELIRQSDKTVQTQTSSAVAARLRLAAGQVLLELCTNKHFANTVKPNTIYRLVFLIQDENEQVRAAFLEILESFLSTLEPRFLFLVFFAAHEPVASIRSSAKTWVSSMCKVNNNLQKVEQNLPRFIHAIAHQQEFTELAEKSMSKGISFASRYLNFYFELVMTRENASLLYYLAGRVKQYRDSLVSDIEYELPERPFYVDNIYRVADLGLKIIQDHVAKNSWVLETFPGKIQLPKDVFSPMHSSKEAQTVAKTTYLENSDRTEENKENEETGRKRKSAQDQDPQQPHKLRRSSRLIAQN